MWDCPNLRMHPWSLGCNLALSEQRALRAPAASNRCPAVEVPGPGIGAADKSAESPSRLPPFVAWSSRGGFLFHSFQPSFFSKNHFPRVFGGFLERRIPGKNGEVTPRGVVVCLFKWVTTLCDGFQRRPRPKPQNDY